MQNYTHGEYSLPYIDKELDNKRMRQLVDYLINQEKEQSQLANQEEEETYEIPPPPVKRQLPKNNPSKEARYESLRQERALLEVLLMRRPEFWGGEDKKLTTYIALIEKKKRSLQEEVDQINLERSREQKEAQIRLMRLKKQISDLEDSIISERQEIERLSLS